MRMLIVSLIFAALLPSCFSAKYSNKPRVRQEWRTLTEEERKLAAEAMWIMKNTTTQVGRERYGERFMNHDDLTVMHACSVMDPRCDQGHMGPQYATFHRVYELAWENSFLSVFNKIKDDSILMNAMPYWNIALDSVNGKYHNDPDNYIFTDKYFGDFIGDPNNNYVVTNGLFAYWPVVEWTEERYGANSPLNVQCTREQWYVGTKSTVCDECCGKGEDCICDPETSTFKRFVRGNDDSFRRQDRCTPYMARNTWESPAINGMHDFQNSELDYEACQNPKNVRNWMDWQNCIEFGQPACLALVAIGHDCKAAMPSVVENMRVTDTKSFIRKTMLKARLPRLCRRCSFSGSYTLRNGRRKKTIAQHTLAHVTVGGDFGDLLTSPNDAATFFGYHANSDRNHMEWMINTHEKLERSYWKYPRSVWDFRLTDIFKISGPWPTYPVLACGFQPGKFSDYFPFARPWLPGTLLNDVVSAGFPIVNLFDTPPGNGWGYTHKEVIYHSSPQRTPYTYDTLAHYYYDSDFRAGRRTEELVGNSTNADKSD